MGIFIGPVDDFSQKEIEFAIYNKITPVLVLEFLELKQLGSLQRLPSCMSLVIWMTL